MPMIPKIMYCTFRKKNYPVLLTEKKKFSYLDHCDTLLPENQFFSSLR